MARRRPPADLGPAGRALWLGIDRWRVAQGLAFDPHEEPLRDGLARLADRQASLRTALAATVPNDPAWTRMATEERLSIVAYGRVMAQLGLPSGVVPDADTSGKIIGLSTSSRRAQKAARARWGSHGPAGATEARHAS